MSEADWVQFDDQDWGCQPKKAKSDDIFLEIPGSNKKPLNGRKPRKSRSAPTSASNSPTRRAKSRKSSKKSRKKKKKRSLGDIDYLNNELGEEMMCPICLEPLCAPIVQCLNGHMLHGKCQRKGILRKCPTCRVEYGPKGPARSLIAEKLAQSLGVAPEESQEVPEDLRPKDFDWDDFFQTMLGEGRAMAQEILEEARRHVEINGLNEHGNVRNEAAIMDEMKQFGAQKSAELNTKSQKLIERLWNCYNIHNNEEIGVRECKRMARDRLQHSKAWTPIYLRDLMKEYMTQTDELSELGQGGIDYIVDEVAKGLRYISDDEHDKHLANVNPIAHALVEKLDKNGDGKIKKNDFMENYLAAANALLNTEDFKSRIQESSENLAFRAVAELLGEDLGQIGRLEERINQIDRFSRSLRREGKFSRFKKKIGENKCVVM